jgi:hypothetical protein
MDVDNKATPLFRKSTILPGVATINQDTSFSGFICPTIPAHHHTQQQLQECQYLP